MEGSRVQSIGLVVVFGLGALGVLFAVHSHYPLTEWLIWRYVGYWCLSALWAASCLAVGLRLFDAFRFSDAGREERWVLGFALGVLAFGVSMLLLGFPKLWSGWTFVLLPVAFVTIGRRELWGALRALRSWLRSRPSDHRFVALGVAVLGIVGFLLIYIPILNPINIGYDSRWYHLAVAEQYAVRGGVEAFTEGWANGAQPQFSSTIYGWAFLLPWGTPFDQLELSVHLEMSVFIATLASIPALAKALTGESLPHAWVFMLLFPGLYLYDSNLIGSADHFAAFFAVPVALASYRAWREFSPGSLILTAVVAAGPLLTKYTAVGLLIGPALLLLGRALYLLLRGAARAPSQTRLSIVGALGAGLATGLVVTAPHWLKNLVFYGDPLFPFLHRWFRPHPWVHDAAERLVHLTPTSWQAERSVAGLKEMLLSPFTFALWPHDWPKFHGKVPVFGFLYTMTMPAVLFVQKRARILVLYFVISIGIAFWFWTFHQDRYLQTYLPWMAAAVAAVVSQAWRLATPVRVVLVGLIGAQIAAGAGVPFLPTHAMNRRSPYVTSIDLLGGWRSKSRIDLETPLPRYSSLARRLPEDAKVLIHDDHLTLGAGRPVVTDALAWQMGIDYAANARPSQMWKLFRSHGVSHVVWSTGQGYGHNSIASDVAFHYSAGNHLRDESSGKLRVGAVPSDPPSDEGFFGRVTVLGCQRSYDNGVYRLEDLTATWLRGPPEKNTLPKPLKPITSKPTSTELEQLLSDVDAVWIEDKCFRVPAELQKLGFVLAMNMRGVRLYVRDLYAK